MSRNTTATERCYCADISLKLVTPSSRAARCVHARPPAPYVPHLWLLPMRLQTLKQAPEIAYCGEKKRLFEEFLQAIHEVVALNADETKAVIEGDEDFTRFDLLIFTATRKKNASKYALLKHIEAHGC